MFLVELVCCLSVCLLDYLKSSKLIYMQFLPEVCLELRSDRFNFGDDQDYDPDLDYDQ